MIEPEENKGHQALDDILGAITFNLAELCRLDDLYNIVKEAGLMDLDPLELGDIEQDYQALLLDNSCLSPYMMSVKRLIGDVQFKDFYMLYHCAISCTDSAEKRRTLYRAISQFRTLCRTQQHGNKIETKFYLKEYEAWRKAQPPTSIAQAVENAWKAKAHGPNSSIIANTDIPANSLAKCQLDNNQFTDLVFQCLWLDFCMPYVVYVSEPEAVNLYDLRTLRPSGWLNDTVVSCYCQLLQRKSNDCYFVSRSPPMGSFKFDAEKMERETERAKNCVGSKDISKVLIPRCYSNHWSLLEMKMSLNYKREKILSIHHYDSIGGSGMVSEDEVHRCLAYAQKLLADDNCGVPPNYQYTVKPAKIPMQENGYDCGVFVCMIAASLSGVLPFPLSQINQDFITYRNCRASICASILAGEIISPRSNDYR